MTHGTTQQCLSKQTGHHKSRCSKGGLPTSSFNVRNLFMNNWTGAVGIFWNVVLGQLRESIWSGMYGRALGSNSHISSVRWSSLHTSDHWNILYRGTVNSFPPTTTYQVGYLLSCTLRYLCPNSAKLKGKSVWTEDGGDTAQNFTKYFCVTFNVHFPLIPKLTNELKNLRQTFPVTVHSKLLLVTRNKF
jgi:hypothetical protein